MEKQYYIYTYGCQMNVHESEKLAGMLQNIGYTSSAEVKNADIILFNTCCIRDTAEKKILGNIGDIKQLKKKNPDLIVAIVGCMTQQEGMAENLHTKFPYINIVLGTDNLNKLPELVENIANKRTKFDYKINSDPLRDINEDIPVFRTSGTNAWVNIMYGCNNFCTYCIVPYVRGRERSRKPSLIIDDVKRLIDNGYKEITLLGQNVDSYKYVTETKEYNFVAILEEIAKIDAKFRLRFMTSHPKDFHSGVIDIIKSCDNICNNIHLPVQAGSDRILKLMNRHYTRERYLDIVQEIYEKLPTVGLTSDIMVGFPTETDEDFIDTLDLVKKVRFSNAFTFVYSPRKGTAAAKMEQVPSAIKKERITKLVALQNSISAEISQTYIGKTEEILIEDVNKKKENYVCGRTESGRLVNFDGKNHNLGEFVKVKITSTKSSSLWGEIDG